MPDIHAMLSASGSKRWLACPPAPALEAKYRKLYPETTSVFAEEGTAAHALAELKLRKLKDEMAGLFKTGKEGEALRRRRNREIAKFKKASKFYNKEMDNATNSYCDTIEEAFAEALSRSSDAVLFIEERVDFSDWVPGGFGTADCVIIADDLMEVIDLKYGKGIPVYAKDNPQIRLYGLGAYVSYSDLYDIKKVKGTIIQPRLDSISSEELTAEDLTSWGDTEVKPKAELAATGGGEKVSGDHCRWCAIKAVCRRRAEDNLALAERFGMKDPDILTINEIAGILGKIKALENWAKDVGASALTMAIDQEIKFPGWKLVAGRSCRKITDPEEVISTLELEGFDEKSIYNKNLKGITDLQKLLGGKKMQALIGDLLIAEPGRPTLVPETDKRTEISSSTEAATEFDEILQ